MPVTVHTFESLGLAVRGPYHGGGAVHTGYDTIYTFCGCIWHKNLGTEVCRVLNENASLNGQYSGCLAFRTFMPSQSSQVYP